MKKNYLSGLLASFMISLLLVSAVQAQWNSNTSVNIQISSLSIADMQSVGTSDAKTWVAFYHQNGSNYEMRAQLFDANGYKLLGGDGILVSDKPTGSAIFVFNVCVDASNNLVIGCQDQRSGQDGAVVYKISQTGQHLWDPDGIVLGLGLAPYPALLSNGEIVVAWIETSTNTLQIQKITTSGTAAWTTPIVVQVGSKNTTRGQLVGNLDGKFTMVYQKQGYGVSTTLYAQQFSNSGTALFLPLQLSTQTTAAYRYYSIAAEADTTYFGYFTSVGFRFNSYVQRINPDGTIPWGMNGSNFNIYTGNNDSYQGPTNINLTPGSPYVWAVCTFSDPSQSLYGIYVQKFLKSMGERQFTDLGKSVYPISANMYQQEGILALVEDTPMFMFYGSDYRIYSTRLDTAGNFAWPGNEVEISSTQTTMSQPKGRFCFSTDGPNRCAGFWVEKRTSNYLGYAQGISVGGLISLSVATYNGGPAQITIPGGTLQMEATVYPVSSNQNVTWSIVPGTGQATIDSNGLVTAIANGTVWAKAAAVQDQTVIDSLMITITNQLPSGIGNIGEDPADPVHIYPVPCNGKFTVEIAGSDARTFELSVYNVVGEKLYSSGEFNITGIERKEIDIRPARNGIYYVDILIGNSRIIKKIVVNN